MNNIKKLRKEHRISGQSLGLAIGKSQATISKWERKEKLSYEHLKLIADFFNVPVSLVCSSSADFDMDIREDMVSIEIIATPIYCNNEHPKFQTLGHQLMPLSMLQEFTHSSPKDIKIIRIESDAMNPTLNSNDMVWVDISVTYPNEDGIYLLKAENNLVPKRILINPVEKSAVIKSDNPLYENFFCPNYRLIKTFGKIIYHIQKVV